MFNPDATVVTLEQDDGKAVYDEKLKRWIFPGDNLEEISKPLPPPPKGPLKMNTPDLDAKGSEASKPSDPLGNLMAPPPRRLVGSATHTVARSRYPDPMASMGVVSSSGSNSNSPPKKPSIGSKPPSGPPKFTVFKPVAKTEQNEK